MTVRNNRPHVPHATQSRGASHAPSASKPPAATPSKPAHKPSDALRPTAAQPAAPVVSHTSVSAQPKRSSQGLQPTAAQPAAPVVSHTSVSPNPGAPSPHNPFVSKLNTHASGSATPYSGKLSTSAPHPTAELSSDGLSLVSGASHGGKLTLGGAQVQADAHYTPGSNVQLGAQGSASGSVASASASASNAYDAVSGMATGKLSASLQGPQLSANASQTTQLGSHVSNTLEASGSASAGSASASLGGQLNTHNGAGGVSGNFSLMGPHAQGSIGHTTTLGPFTFSNALTGSVGTAGLSGSAHAGSDSNGVLSWGASTHLLAGGGLGVEHNASFDPSWFKSSEPTTALGQAQQNQKKYGASRA